MLFINHFLSISLSETFLISFIFIVIPLSWFMSSSNWFWTIDSCSISLSILPNFLNTSTLSRIYLDIYNHLIFFFPFLLLILFLALFVKICNVILPFVFLILNQLHSILNNIYLSIGFEFIMINLISIIQTDIDQIGWIIQSIIWSTSIHHFLIIMYLIHKLWNSLITPI